MLAHCPPMEEDPAQEASGVGAAPGSVGGGAFGLVIDALRRWDAGEPPAPTRMRLTADLPRLLMICDALGLFVESATLVAFRGALERGEPEATAAAASVVEAGVHAADECISGTFELFRTRHLEQARRLGLSTARLVGAVGTAADACQVLICVARCSYGLGRLPECVAGYDQVIELGRSTRPRPDAVLSMALDNRGLALLEMGQVDDALRDFAAAKQLAPTDDRRAHVAIDNQRAEALRQIEMYRQSIALYRRILSTIEAYPEELSERRAITLDNLGAAYLSAGWLREATAAFEQSRELLRGTPADRRYVNAGRRSSAHAAAGRRREAASAFREALELARADVRSRLPDGDLREGLSQAVGSLVPPEAEAWQERVSGLAHGRQGRYDEAMEHFGRGVALAVMSGDPLTELVCRMGVAGLMAEKGGRAREAQAISAKVRAEGEERVLAPVIALADATLSALLMRGLDGSDTGADSLYLCVEGLLLAEWTAAYADEFPDQVAVRIPQPDQGLFQARLAEFAARSHDLETAIPLYRAATAAARAAGDEFALVRRLTSLVVALRDSGEDMEIRDAIAELRRYAESSARHDVRLQALLAVGVHDGDRAAALEAGGRRAAPGGGEADVARGAPGEPR